MSRGWGCFSARQAVSFDKISMSRGRVAFHLEKYVFWGDL